MFAQSIPDVANQCRNQHHRFQNFIDSAYLLAEHSEQKIELLIIEWNPPEHKRRILDAFVCATLFQMMLSFVANWICTQRFRRSKYLNYRIITVSNKIHNILPNKGNAPLHEFEGKNVGIRFARGEFVVCTNQGRFRPLLLLLFAYQHDTCRWHLVT